MELKGSRARGKWDWQVSIHHLSKFNERILSSKTRRADLLCKFVRYSLLHLPLAAALLQHTIHLHETKPMKRRNTKIMRCIFVGLH